jgi:predicted dithiol-disulfide oxidoreductase (DUF899 family)
MNTFRARVVTPAEWEAARLRLLAKEQELTRAPCHHRIGG